MQKHSQHQAVDEYLLVALKHDDYLPNVVAANNSNTTAQQGRALLAAFVRDLHDPESAKAWDSVGWSDASNPCDPTKNWLGVRCSHNIVDTVDLDARDDVAYSHAGFSIGGAVAALSEMRSLSILGTRISGTVPFEIGQISSLQQLYLASNPFLSGTLPSSIGRLTQLINFNVAGQVRLSGTLPTFSRKQNLRNMGAYSSILSGTVPFEVGAMDALVGVETFSSPLLSGTLPALASRVLLQLIVHTTSISGSIPAMKSQSLQDITA